MAHFEALPSELLARVIGFLDKASLAQTRLVNTRFEQLSVKPLFANVTLYAHWKKQIPSSRDSSPSIFRRRRRLSIDSSDDESSNKQPRTREYISDNDVSDESDDEPSKSPVNLFTEASGNRLSKVRDSLSDEELRNDGNQSGVEETQSDFEILLPEENSHQDEAEKEYFGPESLPIRKQPDEGRVPQYISDGLPGPQYDSSLFKNILEDAILKKYVKTVQVFTCNTDCDFHPSWFWKTKGDLPPREFDPIYLECIQRLGEFQNARALTVHFDRHATGGNDIGDEQLLQNADFQPLWLGRILSSVDKQITELSIRHYENALRFNNNNSREPSKELSAFLKSTEKLKSLRLSITHEESNRLNVGPTYKCGNIHPFWDGFSASILEPRRQQLTNLVLYSDLPLGWFPKLDLRKVHFPKLRSLTLGQHIFHDNFQVDWIISHKSTLEELYLDRCSILYQIGYTVEDWIDEDGYPKPGDAGDYGWSSAPEHVGDDDEFDQTLQFKSFAIRWHDVFSRLAEALDLRDFRFGASKQWRMDTDSRYIEQGDRSGGHPIMPWEDEHNIPNEISRWRYVIYDDMLQSYREKWTSDSGVYNNDRSDDRGWRKEWKDRFETYPDCKDADESALLALSQKVEGR